MGRVLESEFLKCLRMCCKILYTPSHQNIELIINYLIIYICFVIVFECELYLNVSPIKMYSCLKL